MVGSTSEGPFNAGLAKIGSHLFMAPDPQHPQHRTIFKKSFDAGLLQVGGNLIMLESSIASPSANFSQRSLNIACRTCPLADAPRLFAPPDPGTGQRNGAGRGSANERADPVSLGHTGTRDPTRSRVAGARPHTRGAAREELHPAPDLLFHRLTISGSTAMIVAFASPARGSGITP
jgi:hypothetical protein